MGRLRRYLGEMRALNAIPSVRRQATLDMLHRTLLSGLGYGNSDPVRNGELSIARELLAELPGRSRVVFDVGASRGEYSAMLLERVESNLEVYCFEPSRVAFAELTERLGLSPRVRVANIGLSDVEGEATLYSDAPGSGCASLYDRALTQNPLAETVRVRRLDLVCRELGIASIDLLKVDAEGHDLKVLLGAGRLLDEQRIAAIQFEHGGTAPDARVFLRDFFDLLAPSYLIHRVLPDGLWPLERYSEQLELSLYANYVALPTGP